MQFDESGKFRVLNELGSTGDTRRLEGLLNGLKRDDAGNMTKPIAEPVKAAC